MASLCEVRKHDECTRTRLSLYLSNINMVVIMHSMTDMKNDMRLIPAISPCASAIEAI